VVLLAQVHVDASGEAPAEELMEGVERDVARIALRGCEVAGDDQRLLRPGPIDQEDGRSRCWRGGRQRLARRRARCLLRGRLPAPE
jgi:hypothetical protein